MSPDLREQQEDGSTSRGRSSAEKAAINESRFRESNERIEEVVEQYGLRQHLPFLCECADPECTVLVRMSHDEYLHVRSDSRWFLNATGHEDPGSQHSRIVEEYESYDIVEKTGKAGEIAAELDDSDIPSRDEEG